MSYGIIRVAKAGGGAVKGLQIHDNREKDSSKTNPDIDFKKSHENIDLVRSDNWDQSISNRLDQLENVKTIRKDAVLLCDVIVTSDNDFFAKLTPEREKAFFNDALKFVGDKFGKENIISAVIHKDETTPHLHIKFVPITKDGRLCAKDVLGGKKEFYGLQDDFFAVVSKRWGLERGESKNPEKRRKHLDTAEFKIKAAGEKLAILEHKASEIEDSIAKKQLVLERFGDYTSKAISEWTSKNNEVVAKKQELENLKSALNSAVEAANLAEKRRKEEEEKARKAEEKARKEEEKARKATEKAMELELKIENEKEKKSYLEQRVSEMMGVHEQVARELDTRVTEMQDPKTIDLIAGVKVFEEMTRPGHLWGDLPGTFRLKFDDMKSFYVKQIKEHGMSIVQPLLNGKQQSNRLP